MRKILLFIIISIGVLSTLAHGGAFHDYIHNCDYTSVKKFIDAGIDINSLNENRTSPLWHALATIKCGENAEGDRKKYNLIKLLLDNGVNVNGPVGVPDYLYLPDYFYGYKCRTNGIKCYELFAGKGADLLYVLKEQTTPLTLLFYDLEIQNRVNSKTAKQQIQIYTPTIRYLLEKGVNPNILVELGNQGHTSILDIAYNIGDFNVITLLKKHGAKKKIDIEIDKVQSK
jgi:ankyrin repeat protein